MRYENRYYTKDNGWSEWESIAPIGFSAPVRQILPLDQPSLGPKRVTFTWPDGDKLQWRRAK